MRVFAVVLVMALLAIGPVSAQTPPSPAASVSVTIEGDAVKVSADQGGSFRAIVQNTGTGSGTPVDDQNQADVDVTVSGVPPGWAAVPTPASFKLSPGQQQEVVIQVTVSADAQAKTAELTVAAHLEAPLDAFGQILNPGGVPQTADASDSIRAARDDSVTRDLLEGLGKWIYAILLLLVAAVIVAVSISLAGRRALVRLSSDARDLTLPPGGRVAFPFMVEGLAKVDDAVLLQVSAVQEGWAAFLPVPELSLGPGQVQELTLIVISPRNAPDGARQAILVSATSAKAPKGAANLEFIANVQSGTPVRAAKRVKDE